MQARQREERTFKEKQEALAEAKKEQQQLKREQEKLLRAYLLASHSNLHTEDLAGDSNAEKAPAPPPPPSCEDEAPCKLH